MGASRRLELARPALALRRLIDATPIRRSDSSPLAIVLSGGGARAAYQTGVLSYVCRRLPSLSVPIVTGVSAGAINAAFLAAQCGPLDTAVEALKRRWCSLTTEQVFRVICHDFMSPMLQILNSYFIKSGFKCNPAIFQEMPAWRI